MANPTKTRPVLKNFLGNTNTKEAHDLRSETRQCQIDEIIRAGHAVTFTPDSLAQAKGEGYDGCYHCTGSSTR